MRIILNIPYIISKTFEFVSTSSAHNKRNLENIKTIVLTFFNFNEK